MYVCSLSIVLLVLEEILIILDTSGQESFQTNPKEFFKLPIKNRRMKVFLLKIPNPPNLKKKN